MKNSLPSCENLAFNGHLSEGQDINSKGAYKMVVTSDKVEPIFDAKGDQFDKILLKVWLGQKYTKNVGL